MNMKQKIKLKILAIIIYQTLSGLAVFVFAAALFIILTRRLTKDITSLPSIFIIGWIIGGITLVLYTLSKNWSIFPLRNKKE